MINIQMIPNQISPADCQRLRLLAEQSDDPELYEMAAGALESLGFPTSAARLRERAKYYRRLLESEK